MKTDKQQTTRQAPLRISRNEPEAEPVVDSRLNEEEADLQRESDALEQKRAELATKKQEAQEAEYARRFGEYETAREDSVNFRASAANETDEASKKAYLRWAIEADKLALSLAGALGLDIPKELQETAEPKPATNSGNGRTRVLLQMALLVGIIWLAYALFVGYGEHIQALNRAIPETSPELKMQPYDATSIQKFFLEKFYEFFDLPLALGKILIVAPFALFYMLPFVRTKKDFVTEFFQELTPFQRCILTICLLSLFLFHSALSHLVKP